MVSCKLTYLLIISTIFLYSVCDQVGGTSHVLGDGESITIT